MACKPDLTENWRAEVGRVLPGRSVTVATGMTPTPVPAGMDVVIRGCGRRWPGRPASIWCG